MYDLIYSFNNDWIISAPCHNRNGAVSISNQLIQKNIEQLNDIFGTLK